MEARGNSPAYPAQGTNYVRASLNYGVLPGVQTHLFGWWEDKRSAFSEQFHTYALEWTDGWMRLYVDSRLQAMMNIKITGKGGKSFYDQGNYPSTATNGSNTEVVVQDIWSEAGGGPNAPYDQEFYLILDVAAGGTSGWFPDNVGGKPWYDGSATAMREFALAQDTWSATWPSDADDRAFRVCVLVLFFLFATRLTCARAFTVAPSRCGRSARAKPLAPSRGAGRLCQHHHHHHHRSLSVSPLCLALSPLARTVFFHSSPDRCSSRLKNCIYPPGRLHTRTLLLLLTRPRDEKTTPTPPPSPRRADGRLDILPFFLHLLVLCVLFLCSRALPYQYAVPYRLSPYCTIPPVT